MSGLLVGVGVGASTAGVGDTVSVGTWTGALGVVALGLGLGAVVLGAGDTRVAVGAGVTDLVGLGDTLRLGDALGVAKPAETGAVPTAARATGVTRAAPMTHLAAGSMRSTLTSAVH